MLCPSSFCSAFLEITCFGVFICFSIHIICDFYFFSQDKDKVSKFVSWATLTALQSNIEKVHGLETFDCIMRLQSEEESDDSLISKLVRWLTASVIVGKHSLKFSNLDICHSFDRSKFNNLFSMMEWNEQKLNSSSRTFACDETLALSIFFLQQLQRTNYTVLPSVVSALCLLSSSLSSAGTLVILLVLLSALKTTCCLSNYWLTSLLWFWLLDRNRHLS